ncbi:MAG: hypothetical protein JEZ01_04355 [Labilibaculum sp.]|nr:hypothetical protein [Labilibaculum sp.]MBI9056984.1 hypothetical protein [Labilibaculum sp.]
MKIINILLIFAGLSLFISCDDISEREAQLDCLNFGCLEYYKPFLGVRKDTALIEKKLSIDFNDFAKEQQAYVTLFVVDKEGNTINDACFQLLVNNKLCSSNSFFIQASEIDSSNIVKVAIKILPGAAQKKEYLYLAVKNHNLDRVGNFDLGSDNRVMAVQYEYNEVFNPLALTLFIFAVVVLSFIILWFLILRNLVYPKMKKGKITINDPYFKSIKYKGVRKVVFTNNKYSQSGFDKLFRGRILFNQNSIWTKDFILLPGSKKEVKYKLPLEFQISNQDPNSNDFLSTLKKFNNYTIVTEEKIKIEFTNN